MTTYNGDDATAGSEVSWYKGGVQTTETKTVAGGDVSAGFIALAAKAEQGSVQLKVDSTVTGCVEYSDASGNTIATDSTGTLSFKYTGITAAQVLTIDYLSIAVTTLTEIAMCQDVKTSLSIDELTEDVHGQVNKVKKTGTTTQTADLGDLDYTTDFLAAFFGNTTTDASGNIRYTTKYTGARKVGALVGKRRNTSGTITKKYFLYGCQPTGLDKDFPASGIYKNSIKLTIDDYSEWEASST